MNEWIIIIIIIIIIGIAWKIYDLYYDARWRVLQKKNWKEISLLISPLVRIIQETRRYLRIYQLYLMKWSN
jgi:hypothetical protein